MSLYNNILSSSNNRYDRYLILLILSLGMGDIGSPLLLSRILAVLFIPSLLRVAGKCSYIRNAKSFFLFLMAFSVFSLAWTFNFIEGCKAIVYNILHFSLFFEIIVFSSYANNPLKSISNGWTLVILLLSIIAIWEVATGNHLSIAYEETQNINMGGGISARILANGTFGNYNKLVMFFCMAIPWLFFRMNITLKEILAFIITLLTLILSILVIFIDGSRGGLFAVLISIGVYMFFMPKGKASFLISLLFIGTLLFILIKYSEQIFLVLTMKSEGQGLASDSSRIEIWKVCLKALINSFGLGSGIGGVSGAIESVSINVINVPHNMVIEAFLEYGFVIGIVFITFILRMLRKGFKLSDKNRRMAVMMAILSMPLYAIINSLYLKGPEIFALFATIYVFVNYELIKSVCK